MSFSFHLTAWFKVHARDLPWRRQRSLYRTLISEFMLQQTQVSTVIPFFEKWMQRFPSIAEVAQAEEREILKHWEGLGYYSRARNLHKLSQVLTQLDTIPQTASEWQKLPGVGPYTAAAITSISFGYPEPVIDGNVIRILTRLEEIDREFDNASARKRLYPQAKKLLDPHNAGAHNEAMMELGATLCHKQNPLCEQCPVYSYCAAGQEGNPNAYPRIRKRKTQSREISRYLICHEDEILLYKTPKNQRLAGLYEIPEVQHLPKLEKHRKKKIFTGKRGISNERLTEYIYQCPKAISATIRECSSDHPRLHWIPREKISQIALSGPHKKWLKTLDEYI